MLRTQIQLEERQYEALRAIAHRKRLSLSEVVRRAVDVGLEHGLEKSPEASGTELLLGLAGVSKSGLRDLGRAHDRYLALDTKP